MDHAFFLSIFSVFSHARAGYFFGVLKTADKLLIFVVLAGALFVVWKLRERILLFLTGDTRLRVDIYDFVQCLLCCGCAGRCCPAIVPGASRVVRLKRVECRNFPAHDWMGTSDLFLKVSLGTNAELSTRVREKKRHVCIFTEQLEVNVKNPCCGPCTKWCNCAQSCGDEDCRAYCSCDQEMHIILMDQDVAFHDEVGRVLFNSSEILRLAANNAWSGWRPIQSKGFIRQETAGEMNVLFEFVPYSEGEEMLSPKGDGAGKGLLGDELKAPDAQVMSTTAGSPAFSGGGYSPV